MTPTAILNNPSGYLAVNKIAKKAMSVMTESTPLRAYKISRCGIASSHLTKISRRESSSGYSTSN